MEVLIERGCRWRGMRGREDGGGVGGRDRVKEMELVMKRRDRKVV